MRVCIGFVRSLSAMAALSTLALAALPPAAAAQDPPPNTPPPANSDTPQTPPPNSPPVIPPDAGPADRTPSWKVGPEDNADHILERFGVEIGVFTPVASPVPTNDNTWALLQISYSLDPPRSRKVFQSNIYLDIAGNNGKTVYSDDFVSVSRGRAFSGLGLAERAQFALSRGGDFSLAFGAGGGLYNVQQFHHYSYPYTDDDGVTENNAEFDNTDRNSVRLGYHLFATLKHRSGLYFEAGLIDAGKMSDQYFRGTTFAIGYRR